MIYDQLENASVYHFGPAFEKAVRFVQGLKADTPNGKYEIDGDAVYARVMEYDTAEGAPEKYEVHRRYADLQAVITGHETIFARLAGELPVHTPYNAEKDCEVLAPDDKAYAVNLAMFPGYFALLFPQDAHMGKGTTCLGRSSLRKVVVKIALGRLRS